MLEIAIASGERPEPLGEASGAELELDRRLRRALDEQEVALAPRLPSLTMAPVVSARAAARSALQQMAPGVSSACGRPIGVERHGAVEGRQDEAPDAIRRRADEEDAEQEPVVSLPAGAERRARRSHRGCD